MILGGMAPVKIQLTLLIVASTTITITTTKPLHHGGGKDEGDIKKLITKLELLSGKAKTTHSSIQKFNEQKKNRNNPPQCVTTNFDQKELVNPVVGNSLKLRNNIAMLKVLV